MLLTEMGIGQLKLWQISIHRFQRPLNVIVKDKHEDIFPLYLLPRIVEPCTIVGKTSGAAFGPIPQGIPVLVPLGDLQATLLPILGNGEAGK
jgi:sugar (pentulose or hexulose) kinase